MMDFLGAFLGGPGQGGSNMESKPPGRGLVGPQREVQAERTRESETGGDSLDFMSALAGLVGLAGLVEQGPEPVPMTLTELEVAESGELVESGGMEGEPDLLGPTVNAYDPDPRAHEPRAMAAEGALALEGWQRPVGQEKQAYPVAPVTMAPGTQLGDGPTATAVPDGSGPEPATDLHSESSELGSRITILEAERAGGLEEPSWSDDVEAIGARLRLETRPAAEPTVDISRPAVASGEEASGDVESSAARQTGRVVPEGEVDLPLEAPEAEAVDFNQGSVVKSEFTGSGAEGQGVGEGHTELEVQPTAQLAPHQGGEVEGSDAPRGPAAGSSTRETEFASRVARVLELQDGMEARPVSRVLLRLDDGVGGVGTRVRVGVQQGVVAVDIGVSDPFAASRLQGHLDELAHALTRQGLEPGQLRVDGAMRSQVDRSFTGIAASGLEPDVAGIDRMLDRGEASGGRSEGRSRGPDRRDAAMDQERSRKEQKQGDER